MTGYDRQLSVDPTRPKRKLLLHFDQHNTIQVACTLPGRRITVEEGLNNFLTSAVWGKELNNEWVWVSHEPQLSKPVNEPDAITYFKYLEKKIVKSPNDRAELKKKTCQFVYEEPGLKFREFFDIYLHSLTYESNYNETSENDDTSENNARYYNGSVRTGLATKIKLPSNTIPAGDPSNTSLYHLILPEFFDMIRRLQKEKREFAIILRTMGIDSQNFLDTVKPIFEGKHRDFKDLEPIKINPVIGQMRRYPDDKICLEMDNQVYSDEEEIYKKLSSLEGINAIRDDFAYWQMNDYECYSAKPLWVNFEDGKNQHIIFDDNVRLDEFDDCIVNVRLKGLGMGEFVNVDFESYGIFEKSSILQPNLLQLLNPHLRIDSTKNHYCEKIKKAEKVYDIIFENTKNLKIQTKLQTDDLESSTGSLKLEILDSNNVRIKDTEQICNNNSSNNKNDFKSKTNIKLTNSFSKKFEQEGIQIEKADQKFSTVCVIN